MGSVPILCVNVNITIETMLKFDANADAYVNIDAQCEQTLSYISFHCCSTSKAATRALMLTLSLTLYMDTTLKKDTIVFLSATRLIKNNEFRQKLNYDV